MKDRITWDEFFMGIAKLAAMRSLEKETKVGACIVNEAKKIIGTGYNGTIRGIDNSLIPWTREGKWLDTKYPYIVHSEINAILNSTFNNLTNCSIYVTLYPCNDCAKAIIQSGIKTVYYLEDKHPDDDIYIAAKKLFALAKIKVIQLKENIND